MILYDEATRFRDEVMEPLPENPGAKAVPNRAVEALRSKWDFPSDHLPVSAKIELLGGSYTFASWNTLNSAYMHYIENDEQGLVGSLITQQHAPEAEGPTEREKSLVRSLQELLDSSVSICCLQEVGKEFRSLLREALFESHPPTRDTGRRSLRY